MIRLTKGARPAVLEEKGELWTEEYRRWKSGDPSVPKAAEFRYRHPDIKAAVKEEAHNKCIYCESKPLHVHSGDVEHVIPKSKYPDLVVEWNNLAFVCSECNKAKGAYADEVVVLVNPFVEDPDHFLIFLGPVVFHRAGSERGAATIRQLQLDRAHLVDSRRDRILAVGRLLDEWKRLPPGDAKNAVRAEILREAADDREYAAAIRSFLKAQDDA